MYRYDDVNLVIIVDGRKDYVFIRRGLEVGEMGGTWGQFKFVSVLFVFQWSFIVCPYYRQAGGIAIALYGITQFLS